jgi:N-hydroxyarylamine O-acetyltransferase
LGGAEPRTLIDLPSYFERIAYTGPHDPTLETLRALHLQHTLAIPFENLDPLLGRPVNLDPASLQGKLIAARRGGYCYEQGCLMLSVLKQLGFEVTGLAARVLWNVPAGIVRPRSHMLLRVDLREAIYLTDVGFGGLTPTAPLRLAPGVEQRTPHESFRVIPDQDAFLLQACVENNWKSLYRFDLQPQVRADYEVMSWYLCHHPSSTFRNTLFVARNTPGRRYVLLGNQVGVHHVNGPTERRTLTCVDEMRATLADTFGIQLPDAPELEGILSQLIKHPP